MRESEVRIRALELATTLVGSTRMASCFDFVADEAARQSLQIADTFLAWLRGEADETERDTYAGIERAGPHPEAGS